MASTIGDRARDGNAVGFVGRSDELRIASDVRLEPDSREVRLNGNTVQLTPLEFGVLECLQRHEGRAVSRAILLDEVWGYDTDVGSNVVDVVIRRVRDKLGDHASVLETVRGSGYRLTNR